MIKVAFCTVPHTGGIYTVYKRLRDNLGFRNIDVKCVYVGDEQNRWYGFDESLADNGCVHLNGFESDLKKNAMAFTQWVKEENVDIVLPMSSQICLSSVPYLPAHIKTVTRCVSTTPFTYRLATAWPSLTSRFVYTSLRQKTDLIRKYGISEENLFHIPNSIDTDKFYPDSNEQPDTLTIGFVDRIDDREKNVFQIPSLLNLLDHENVPYRFVVVGSGPDEEKLRDMLAPWVNIGKLTFLPAQPYACMPDVFRGLDIMVKLSPSEGFPSSVIEAMSSGVVPICYRLRGVTDWIINHGHNGFVAPINNLNSIKHFILELTRNRQLLTELSKNARSRVVNDFNMEKFCNRWEELFHLVTSLESKDTPVMSWDDFEICHVWRAGFLHRNINKHIPRNWRKYLRILQEKYFS